MRIHTEVEEIITTYEPPNNGAGPLWCYGSPLIVRQGEEVFVCTMETGKGIGGYNNTRWLLWRRDSRGWCIVHQQDDYREREPCPLARFADGRLILSVNSSLRPPGIASGMTVPYLLEFDGRRPRSAPRILLPRWSKDLAFREHSYRGLGVDSSRCELLVLDNEGENTFWSFRDQGGAWPSQGELKFPIRGCYPQVALRNGAGHVLAIGDIVEPVEEWRKYKFDVTQRHWDFVFRRLFYTWSPDVRSQQFAEPVEVETLETTAGWIRNLDLWLDPRGAAHILYQKQNIQSDTMRDRFFPGTPIEVSLEYVIIEGEKIVRRQTLARSVEGGAEKAPYWGRLHATPSGRLYAIASFWPQTNDVMKTPGSGLENRLIALSTDCGSAETVQIPLNAPMAIMFTATERGGSLPSATLDLYGIGLESLTLRYARVKIEE